MTDTKLEPCEGCGETVAFNCALTRPDWTRKCEVCNATPVVPVTGLCGPCNFGEAETIGGNW